MPDAKAPYNFVPLPNKVMAGSSPPARDKYHPVLPPPARDSRYTGWFDVVYRTLTPTYTRAAKGVSANFPAPFATDDNGNPADFFHRGNATRTPVLPGSSLRGMVRSVFEVLTYSRMEFVSERRLFYRYMAAPAHTGLGDHYRTQFQTARLIGGVLNQNGTTGEWTLQVLPLAPKGFVALKVNDPGLTGVDPTLLYRYSPRNPGRPAHQFHQVFVRDTGTTVSLLRGPQQFTAPLYELCAAGALNACRGFLIIPGADVSHRHYYQVILDPAGAAGAVPYKVPGDVYRDYENWRRMARGAWGSGPAPRLLDDGSPAFALAESVADGTPARVAVIGAAMMLTLRYGHAISDVAAKANDPAAPLPERDMTQSVFGCIGPSAEKTIKTRVFFEDAPYRPRDPNESPWLSPNPADSVRIPDGLSGPKPTAVQMYLEQPPAGPLNHYNSPQARLRGFKRYWHRSLNAAQDALHPNDDDLSSQETRIRPVRKETRFVGRVRFENLSETELGALYAALVLPDGCGHRFGMGKSLGLGSLRVTIPRGRVTLLNTADRYQSLARDAGKYPEAEADAIVEKAYTRFVRRVNQHEQECGTPAPQTPSLWNSPRLKTLAALLLYQPTVPCEKTRIVSVDNDPDQIQWRNRYSLPEARQLADPVAVDALEDVIEIT